MSKKRLSVSEVIRFANEVLDYFGLMLRVRFQEGRGYRMNWKEIVISKRVLEQSEEVMKYFVAHEIGHRAIPNAPGTEATRMIIRHIAWNEGMRNADLFLNVICDPVNNMGNLKGKPWSQDYAEGLREIIEGVKKKADHPIYDWLVKMGKASLAEVQGESIDFLNAFEHECYVLLFHDPRDWAERCRDLARKLKHLFDERPKRIDYRGIPFVKPIPPCIGRTEHSGPVKYVDSDVERATEKDFEEIGKALARLYPKRLKLADPRVLKYYRKWTIYSRIIPLVNSINRTPREKFGGYGGWKINMPLREFDVKASMSKYGVIIPNVTTIRKVYKKGGEERKSRSGALVLIIDKSGSMCGSKIEKAIEASVALVEQARRSGDLVSVIAFDGDPWLISPPSRNYTKIINEICGLTADGATSISLALQMALEQRLSRHATFIITDCIWGDIKEALNLLRQLTEKGKTVIFLLGEKPETIDERILRTIKQWNIKIFIHTSEKPFTFKALKEYTKLC
ncbi:MAG: vWA domain-containing protein [Candidatus Freyarchaeota archaeon]